MLSLNKVGEFLYRCIREEKGHVWNPECKSIPYYDGVIEEEKVWLHVTGAPGLNFKSLPKHVVYIL